MKKTLSLALTTMALLAAASCSCGNTIGQAKVGSVNGVVIKGPVAAATVKAFALAGARKGDEVGKGTTAEDGTFTFEVGSHSGPMLVCATSGTYVEESTGGLVQLGTNELCGLVTAHEAGATSTVLVTPLTSLHTALTGCFLDAGRDASVDAAEQHAALRLNDFFAAGQVGFDLRTTIPIDVTAGLAASLTNEAWSGILVAGISESAKGYAVASGLDPGVRVTAATLTTALIQDIDDGACIFDGQTSTSRLVQGTIDLDENTLRGSPQGLATSILRFLESDRNLSGIAQENVRDLVQTMQAHTSEIFGGGGGGADIDSPIVTYSEPTAGSTRGGSIRVTARAVDASRIVEFAFTAPDQAAFIASTFTCTDESGTDCTVTGTLNTGLAPVVDGPLDIVARAVDAAGNPTTQTLSMVVNNTLPSIQVAAPQNEAPVRDVFTIRATASDAEGIASLTVEIPGVGLCDDQPTSPCRDIQPANDTLEVAWDTTTLPEGNVTLLFHAVDAAGQEAEQEVTVLVDNNDIGAITGFVDLGTPVFGATVTALVWTGRVRGGVLGTATTSETGEYRVDLDDAEHASVLMVVTGGSYVDLATGVTFTVADGQELTSAVGAIAPGEVRTTNVNAWTTFAAARAKHTPAGGLEVDAININTALLSQHMRRVATGGVPFSAATTKSADLTSEVVQIDDQRAVLALSHAGLSRLASELSVAQVAAIGNISMTGLITILAEDLEADPSFDGFGATDALAIGSGRTPVTSLTTRFDLVASLDRYLKGTPLIGANVNRNVSGITADNALFGRLYESMAEDNRFELYPDQGRPFDTTSPDITLRFGGTNPDAQPGDPLRDTVQINGTADDDSAIATFGGTLTIDGTFIPDDDNNSTNAALRVFIATDILPNAVDAAGACPNATDAADVSLLQDSVCLCAIAEDIQNNVAEKILCFTRPPPAPTVTTPPTDGAIFIAGSTVVLSANATTGFNAESCEATFTSVPPGRTAPSPSAATIQPTSCQFNQTAPVSAFQDATWTMQFRATDIASTSATTSRTFVVDASPPSVFGLTLTGRINPITAGQIRADTSGAPTSTYLASVTARDNFDIATVVMSIAGPPPEAGLRFVCIEGFPGACSAPGAILRGTVRAPCDPNELTVQPCQISGSRQTDVFTTEIVDAFADGLRTITVQAFDINGNVNTSVSTNLTKDTVPPVFNWLPPGQQDFWHDMSPAAGIVMPRNNVAFVDGAEPQPAATFVVNAIRDAAFSTIGERPSASIQVWRSKIRSGLVPLTFVNPTITPKVRSADVGSGTTSIRFQAAVGSNTVATCPSNPSLTKAPSAGTFTLDLARDDIGFDMATAQDNIVCIRAIPVDAAGNEGAPKDILVRWDTVTPPPTIVVNPNADDDPESTKPFSGAATNAFGFLSNTAGDFSMWHAYVNNPYPFPIQVRLKPHADAQVRLTDSVRLRSAENPSRSTKWPSTSVDLTAPTFDIGAGGTMTWSTTGTDAGDDSANNEIFVKLSSDISLTSPRPTAAKIQNTPFNSGINTTFVNDLPLTTTPFAYATVATNTSFKYYTVDPGSGIVTPTALATNNGFVTIPASTISNNGVFLFNRPSVVVAVAHGRLAAPLSTYRVAPLNSDIATPALLRVANRNTGVVPSVSLAQFVVLQHPIFNELGEFDINGPLNTGTYLFARNGTSANFATRTLCGTAATNAECRFFKRWYTLQQLRAVWETRASGSPRRVAEFETRDTQTNVFTSSSAVALTHPGLTGTNQTLRIADAP
jgi:hypothetical protein